MFSGLLLRSPNVIVFVVLVQGSPHFLIFSFFSLFRVGDLLQTLNSVLVADYLDGVGLRLAAGNQLELSVFAEVLKALTGTPADVYGLDVCGGEVVSRLGGVAAELVVEGAERAEVDAVAGKQLLAKASHRVGQDALDGTLRERRVVFGDVLTELVERQLLVNLRCAIGLGVGDVGLLRSRLGAGNVDTVVNHGFLMV